VIIIYLDQNKLIDLLKASVGKTECPEIRSLHHTLLFAARTGRVVCPLTNIHIIETSRLGNRDKRLQLANLLADLSQGWFLADRSTRLQVEFDHAVAGLYGLQSQGPSTAWPLVRGIVRGFGDFPYLAAKTGTSVSLMQIVTELVDPREQIRSFLAFEKEAVRRRATEHFSQGVSGLVAELEQQRSALAGESADLQSRVYAAQLFLQHQDYLGRALARCGKSFDDLRTLPPELIAGIVDNVPTLQIERSLAVQLNRQRQRRLQMNDGNDLAALCAAIPYCRFVVSENLWADLVRRTRLAERYGTIFLSDLSELSARLEQIT
jgi:hypothetical protein